MENLLMAFQLMLNQSFVNLSSNKINDLREEGIEEFTGALDENQLWLIQSISCNGLINVMSEGGYLLEELSINDLELN